MYVRSDGQVRVHTVPGAGVPPGVTEDPVKRARLVCLGECFEAPRVGARGWLRVPRPYRHRTGHVLVSASEVIPLLERPRMIRWIVPRSV